MPKKLRFSKISAVASLAPAIFAAGLVLSACEDKPRISGQIPAVELPTFDGPRFKLSPQDTMVTLLVFWATWCRPCLMEIPALIELHKGLSDNNFRVVSVNVDDPAGTKIAALKRDFGINYPILLGSDDHLRMFGNIQGLPTSLIVGKDGKVKDRIQGLVPPSELERRVRAVLEG